MSEQSYQERCRAIHFLRSGKSVSEVAEALGRDRSWVYKWQARYQAEGWKGLHDRSRAPKHSPTRISEEVAQAIRETRSELEAEAEVPGKLSYTGPKAIRQRLREKGITPLPGVTSIERVVRAAGMVRPHSKKQTDQVKYPRLTPERPHQLVQVDIVPRHLSGGMSMACFNAIDTVSRYPGGQQLANKGSKEAMEFLLHVWRTGYP